MRKRGGIPKLPYVNDCIQDLTISRAAGGQAAMRANGAVEIAFYRGYQAGYERAIKDEKIGELRPRHATQPGRGKD